MRGWGLCQITIYGEKNDEMYKKQFTLGLLLLLVVLVAVEGISLAWWHNIETCAFEQSDVYADLQFDGAFAGVEVHF